MATSYQRSYKNSTQNTLIKDSYNEVGIGTEHLEEMAETAVWHCGRKISGFQELTAANILAIYRAAL